jgi:hypothetical protein
MEGKFDRKPRRDFFADVRALSKGAGRFRLKTPEHIEAQKAMFRAIHEYLEMFPSIESLMGAAVNLTDRIHGVANYLAEFLVDEESGE